MNTKEQQNKIVGHIAAAAANKAATQVAKSNGWLRWLWGLAAALAGAIAWFTGSAEQQQPPATDTQTPSLGSPVSSDS